jgi:hypothetical protein
MALNFKYLIEQLDIVNPDVIDLRSQVVLSLGNKEVMRGTLNRQCKDWDRTNCFSCKEPGLCSVLTGIGHLDLGEINTGIKKLDFGNQYFRSQDEIWNSITGQVLFGIAYEDSGDNHQALIEYKKALDLLSRNYIRVHQNDYDKLKRARTLETELNAHVTTLFSSRPAAAPQVPAPPPIAKPSENAVENLSAYLSLFSMPIYGTVRAGMDGELHINPAEKSFTIVNKVELEGQLFDVFSVGHTLSRDRQITLNPQESYGWAKVLGLSMNGWDTPLYENDFVLFRGCQTANHNDFVVVSSRDPSGELMYIVKKYDGFDRQFLSKSTDTSQSYDPIPMNEDHKIFGVVIALAKLPVK